MDTEYKDSPLGRIPKEWDFGNFSDYFHINPKVTLNKDSYYDFVEMAAVDSGEKCPKYFLTVDGRKNGSKFEERDVLFARITPCTENGKVVFICSLPNLKYGIGSTEFIVLRNKNNISDPEFLYYYASWDKVRRFAVSRMRGTSGRQRVPNDVFKTEMVMVLPPLTEQRKIAAILSSVDNAIQATKKVIEKTKRLKKGLMQQLLTKDCHKSGSMVNHLDKSIQEYNKNKNFISLRKNPRFYIQMYGQPPKSFKIFRIKDLFKIVERPLEMKKDCSYNLITVKRRHGGIVLRETLPEKKILVKKQYLVLQSDFIISKRQIVHGASGILPKQLSGSIVSGEYLVLHPNPAILDLEFLEYLQETNWFKKTCWFASQGVVIEKFLFKVDQWMELPIALPSLETQRYKATVLKQLDKIIEYEKDKFEKIKIVKKGLMQQLLTGKLRVKI